MMVVAQVSVTSKPEFLPIAASSAAEVLLVLMRSAVQVSMYPGKLPGPEGSANWYLQISPNEL